MKEIGIGVIGFGMMGRTHTYAYQNLPFFYEDLPFRVRLAGVCSGHLEHARQAAHDFGFALATDDYQEILRRDDIDAVSICTPNALHCEMILAALAAGKHVYCDKPLVTSPREAEAVLKALAGCPGIVHQVALHIRFYPAVQRARQMIADGLLGKMTSFRSAFLHSGSIDPQKPFSWRMAAGSGGVLLDLGSHVLDLIYFLAGEYRQVTAKSQVLYSQRPDSAGQLKEILAEDSIIILAELNNGAQGTIEASKIAAGCDDELRLEIHGDRGAIRFNLMSPDRLDYFDSGRPGWPLGGSRGWTSIHCGERYGKPAAGFPSDKVSTGWLRGHVHSLYSFLDCVASGRPASPSFFEGSYIQNIMGRILESDLTGRWADCSELLVEPA